MTFQIEEQAGRGDMTESTTTTPPQTSSVHQVPHSYVTASSLTQDVISTDESTPYARTDKSADFFSS